MTATNQPAPPAPTPTMARAIARYAKRLALAEEHAATALRNGWPNAYIIHSLEANELSLALSAMRAVEAGPKAFGVRFTVSNEMANRVYVEHVEAQQDADHCSSQGAPAVTVPLYAFPSPDGGSAK